MKNYLKFPLPTTATWFRLPERVKALEETGVGSQDLQSVTDQDNTTTNNIELLDTSKILFDNGSRLQKGTTNSQTGGNGGISQICSIDYELKWEAGSQYVMDSNGFTIREVNHTFIFTPGVNDDSTKGFVSGSRWILDNGDIYLCTDNKEGAAVWDQIAPKYKVYTALLTQSGGDGPQQLYSGAVTKGVTYRIKETTTGDFSNVGAPNNNVNTTFVATNDEVPNNYSGGGLAYNTGAPVVTVLENTIGNIWFEYYGIGNYLVKSDNLFIDRKTTFSLSPNGYIESPTDIHSIDISWTPTEENTLGIATYYNYELADDQLNFGGNAFIEIRVYN